MKAVSQKHSVSISSEKPEFVSAIVFSAASMQPADYQISRGFSVE